MPSEIVGKVNEEFQAEWEYKRIQEGPKDEEDKFQGGLDFEAPSNIIWSEEPIDDPNFFLKKDLAPIVKIISGKIVPQK